MVNPAGRAVLPHSPRRGKAFTACYSHRVSADVGAVLPISSRPNLLTAAAIGAIACVAADMVHEAVGHGIASWLVNDPILALSTVALQNATANRFVSAAGTSANAIVGVLALLVLRRFAKFTSWACFLWLFAAFNLTNLGYLVVSAVLNSGDWANVIGGLAPVWLWRGLLGLAGAVFYVLAIRVLARAIGRFVAGGEVPAADIQYFVLPAYLAGGVVMTVASVFNPISPSLILLSGVGASFGLSAGLLFVAGQVETSARNPLPEKQTLPFSLPWLIAAVVISGIFIALLGPGIRLSN